MTQYSILALVLIITSNAWAENRGAAPQLINLMQFEVEQLDALERANRNSQSLPLTLSEIEKLSKAGIKSRTLIEMMRTRKVLAVADADSLIALKNAGADDATVAALSAYAVKPNDHFNLAVRMDVKDVRNLNHAPYLYIEVWNVKKNRQEALLHADLRKRLSTTGGAIVQRDRSDPLLPQNVRSIRFRTQVKTRTPGAYKIRVLLSQTPGLMTISTASGDPVQGVTENEMAYPGASLDNECRLELIVAQDRMVKRAFPVRSARFECRWD